MRGLREQVEVLRWHLGDKEEEEEAFVREVEVLYVLYHMYICINI